MELSDEARKARNAYARAYRRKNLDKIKQYNQRYWEKQAALQVVTDVTDKSSVTDASVTSVTSVTTESSPDGGKRCRECGKVFESKRPDAKFCSAACKQRNYRKEH